MCLLFFVAEILGVVRCPAPGPPTPGCTAAQAATEFKQWLDALFLAVHNNPNCLVTGVAGRERHYGIFHCLKCTQLQEFFSPMIGPPPRLGGGQGSEVPVPCILWQGMRKLCRPCQCPLGHSYEKGRHLHLTSLTLHVHCILTSVHVQTYNSTCVIYIVKKNYLHVLCAKNTVSMRTVAPSNFTVVSAGSLSGSYGGWQVPAL